MLKYTTKFHLLADRTAAWPSGSSVCFAVGRLGSVGLLGRVIPKTQKIVFIATQLSVQQQAVMGTMNLSVLKR